MRRAVTAVVILAASLFGIATAHGMERVVLRRLAGPTRYDTAAAIGRAYWELTGSARPNLAVLTRGDEFPDALAASNIEFGIPLLTTRDTLPEATRKVIADLDVESVVLVGGTSAISERIVTELRSLGVTSIDRIAGQNRYETATETYLHRYSSEGDFPTGTDGRTSVMIASGETYADALAAGPLAAGARLPLLLTSRDHLSAATRNVFDNSNGCPNGICIQQAFILGGTDAVSETVESELAELGVTVRRIAGATRQATASAIATFARENLGFHWTFDHVNLARGDDFPDALAVARLGGAQHAVTLLTASPSDLGTDVEHFLRTNRDSVASIDVLGDERAINETTAQEAVAAATGGAGPNDINGIDATSSSHTIDVTYIHGDCDIPSRVDVREWSDRIEISALEVGRICNDVAITSTVTIRLDQPLGPRITNIVRFIDPRTCDIDGSATDQRCVAVT
jgi:putative cell wall-binding protein